jgi:hypothetical protein
MSELCELLAKIGISIMVVGLGFMVSGALIYMWTGKWN